MRGYLSLAGTDDPTEIPVEDRVGLYRIQERNQQVFAEVADDLIPLGVSDPTVSRKKDAAPVVIVARDEFLEVRNNGNHNPVRVDEKATDALDQEVAEGTVATLKRDATVEIGYQTKLNLVVERSPRKEVNVRGEKVVMGDEYDQSTTVEDSVVNRSNIGGTGARQADAGGGAAVEDSVVNRSNVGSAGDSSNAETAGGADTRGAGGDEAHTDTQGFCDVHDRTFEGEECPQCSATDGQRRGDGPRAPQGGAVESAGGSDRADGSGTDDGTGDGSRDAEGSGGAGGSKYCMFCGVEIPAAAAHCPACGEQLPD